MKPLDHFLMGAMAAVGLAARPRRTGLTGETMEIVNWWSVWASGAIAGGMLGWIGGWLLGREFLRCELSPKRDVKENIHGRQRQ
jgi:hypothetical protein